MQHTYLGPERRHHRAYLTRNTEYHFRGALCIAVRDRRSGRWLSAHLALNRTLSGGVRVFANGSALPSANPPEVGESLHFADGGRDLITSTLCRVERPPVELVASYPPGAAARHEAREPAASDFTG
ncbi:MAG TPA: hypothetical protein VER33_16025 [Polyangiaceae bacterium]|nr:hypothetical protein [Polyangiaceae bacterium]